MRLFRAIVAIASLLAAPLLFAQAPAPTANDQEAAKAHFMAGSAYYEQANYADAVKEFNEAYRLSQRPDLLYNVALAYERLGDLDHAIAALQHYLEVKPDAQDRMTIQTRIENLQKQREARTQPPPSPAPVVAAPPPVAAAPAPHRRHVASLVVGGLGLAALAASIGTGATALSIKSELDGKCMNGVCPTSEQGNADTGQSLAIATDVLIAVGAAAVVTGVVLFIVEAKRAPHNVSVLPTRSGLLVRF